MNFKRIARALICLVLVCALVVNISPIKTEAIVPESIAIGAGIVIGSILLGLGVGMAQDSTQNVLTNLVNDCVDVIQSDYDFIDEDALIQVYADYSAETARYYASQELVEAVQTWMFESETIKYTAGTGAPEGYAYYNGFLFPSVPESGELPYLFIEDTGDGNYYCYRSSSPLVMSYNSSNVSRIYANTTTSYDVYYYTSGRSSWSLRTNLASTEAGYVGFRGATPIWSNYDVLNSKNAEYLVLSSSAPSSTLDSYYESLVEGIALGHVANPDDDLPTGYPVWSGGAISIPGSTADDEERTGYPIGIADTLEGTLNLSQEDVWAGNSSFTSTGTDTETGADTDKTTIGLLGGIKDIIGKIRSAVDAIPDSIADVIAAVKAIPVAIAEAIAAVFIPAEGYVSDKWSVLMDEYPFIEDMTDSFEDLQNFLLNLGETPPIIYINLGATRGSYNMGGVVKLVDLTWYAEFKPTVDLILSAFLYLWFYWRLMLALPGIIQGTSGMWSKADSAAGAGNWERPAARLDAGTNQHLLGASESRTRGRR